MVSGEGFVSGEGWSLVRGGLWRGVVSGEGWTLARGGLW